MLVENNLFSNLSFYSFLFIIIYLINFFILFYLKQDENRIKIFLHFPFRFIKWKFELFN